MIVPGTGVDARKRTGPARPAKDIDASDMERAEG
jgi:hypothetical protein